MSRQFPLAGELMPQIERSGDFIFGSVFHDISKGQGGDHSELGAKEARQFAIRHRIG